MTKYVLIFLFALLLCACDEGQFHLTVEKRNSVLFYTSDNGLFTDEWGAYDDWVDWIYDGPEYWDIVSIRFIDYDWQPSAQLRLLGAEEAPDDIIVPDRKAYRVELSGGYGSVACLGDKVLNVGFQIYDEDTRELVADINIAGHVDSGLCLGLYGRHPEPWCRDVCLSLEASLQDNIVEALQSLEMPSEHILALAKIFAPIAFHKWQREFHFY